MNSLPSCVPWRIAVLSFLLFACDSARAGDLSWSDPAKLPPPPAGAVGYPSRDPNLDALSGFRNPPAGYGEVAFFWWLGDPLTRERLSWELDQLAGKGVMGLQVNYAHSDRGGRSYGLTYPSDPPLFSDNWWNLFQWFTGECRKRGMSTSLSDYTLCSPGQGWWTDEIIAENPAIAGRDLQAATKEIPGGSEVTWELPEDLLSVVAYRIANGSVDPSSATDLRAQVSGRTLKWRAPQGPWRIVAVHARTVRPSINPMDPMAGRKVIEKFFQRFENHCPGEGGKGLNFFFSDELEFGVHGKLWSAQFAEEFAKRKGYDILPVLPSLFTDIGPRTPKVRLDYADVMVSLEEESFFRPVFQWHYDRGMLYGCDHGGRGQNVVEFGDYFRTQRWMTGPGNDSPTFGVPEIIKNKVNASISHLYQRPRVWLEGFHSSGWGSDAAGLTSSTLRNYVAGSNLLTLHGLYYSTHGGWWEWAPPCNHFRMPYWNHMGYFLRYTQRLSYLLSQGVHRCDVAIMYPVASVEAGMAGNEAVQTSFAAGRHLFSRGMDFDFMDFESLARAEVRDRQLQVSGEAYRVLILPSMGAVRHSTIEKALAFYRAGGVVIAIGMLPEASDRIGRDDPELDAAVREIFGITAAQARQGQTAPVTRNAQGGTGMLVRTAADAEPAIARAIPRDFEPIGESRSRPEVLHRKVGPRDVYFVLGAANGTECFFRAKGKVELWDAWTGEVRPLYVLSQTAEGTRVRMPGGEGQLIVFTPGEPGVFVEKTDVDDVAAVADQNGRVTVTGYASKAGEKTATVRRGQQLLTLKGNAVPPAEIALDGLWGFELKPTMDNRWGDFRQPPMNALIGAEARTFRYADETSPNPGWQAPAADVSRFRTITYSFGPHLWKLGPLPAGADTTALERKLATLREVNSADPIEIGGRKYAWQPYEYSLREGIQGDPGHQGYHGLKELVSDQFIALGRQQGEAYVKESPAAGCYYLWTAVRSTRPTEAHAIAEGLRPAAMWVAGSHRAKIDEQFALPAGATPVLLRYDDAGRGSFAVVDSTAPRDWKQTYPLAMRWYNMPGLLALDPKPQQAQPAGWYRFTAPPGLSAMTVVAHGDVRAWIDGQEMSVSEPQRRSDGARVYRVQSPRPVSQAAVVAIRIAQDPGFYGGAALPEPIALDCSAGQIALGDWSKIDGLTSYSGGARYRRSFSLTDEQTRARVVLDLGAVVSSAEVLVNGKPAGIIMAPPWTIDISSLVKPGDNRVEVLVYNTLANHYSTIPTRYRGSLTSGLLGPAVLRINPAVELK